MFFLGLKALLGRALDVRTSFRLLQNRRFCFQYLQFALSRIDGKQGHIFKQGDLPVPIQALKYLSDISVIREIVLLNQTASTHRQHMVTVIFVETIS